MSQLSVRQAARRSALDAQAVLRKQRGDRERRLAGWGIIVLTALGERDVAVRDTERRVEEALRTMTDSEGLADARGGRVVGRRRHSANVTRLRRLDGVSPTAVNERGWPGARTGVKATPHRGR